MHSLELAPPSPEKIARHVKVYGDEGVSDVLRAYGVTEEKPNAAYLREQGYSVEEIAKTLNERSEGEARSCGMTQRGRLSSVFMRA
jgi:hypothetical protein